MDNLDLTQEDMDFLGGLEVEESPTDAPGYDQMVVWAREALTSRPEFLDFYKAKGREMLIGLLAAGAMDDTDERGSGMYLYLLLIKDSMLCAAVMGYATSYGCMCFHAGYRLAKEEEDAKG